MTKATVKPFDKYFTKFKKKKKKRKLSIGEEKKRCKHIRSKKNVEEAEPLMFLAQAR